MGKRSCTACNVTFTPPKSSESHKLCGRCRGRQARQRGRECIESKAREMATKARSRATSRKLPCDIDALWIVTRWYEQRGRCHFSGRPMTLQPGPRCVSLDRLNSSKGYTRRNTVLVAMRVNTMKSDMGVEEFLDWCEAITSLAAGAAQSGEECQDQPPTQKPAPAKPCSADTGAAAPKRRGARG